MALILIFIIYKGHYVSFATDFVSNDMKCCVKKYHILVHEEEVASLQEACNSFNHPASSNRALKNVSKTLPPLLRATLSDKQLNSFKMITQTYYRH